MVTLYASYYHLYIVLKCSEADTTSTLQCTFDTQVPSFRLQSVLRARAPTKNWTAWTKGVVSSFSPPECLVLSRTTQLRRSNCHGYTSQPGIRKDHYYSSTSIAVREVSTTSLSHAFNQPRGRVRRRVMQSIIARGAAPRGLTVDLHIRVLTLVNLHNLYVRLYRRLIVVVISYVRMVDLREKISCDNTITCNTSRAKNPTWDCNELKPGLLFCVYIRKLSLR